jgi:hypothetical protein
MLKIFHRQEPLSLNLMGKSYTHRYTPIKVQSMKNILHSDYWVEVPAGEYQVGLSHEQQEKIASHVFDQVGYNRLTPKKQSLINSAVSKIRKRVELITAFEQQFLKKGFSSEYPLDSMNLSDKEFSLITSKRLWCMKGLTEKGMSV